MTLWTYRFRPVIEGKELPIALESSWTCSRLVVGAPESSGAQAIDRLNFTEEPYRLHEVQAHVPGGPVLITAGPRNWWSFGVTITREGRTLWQSHPNPHAYLARLQAIMNTRGGQAAMDTGVFKRNAPAIATDIALGLLFFILGKTTDLRTAALVTAGVGLALVPIQVLISRFAKRKVDLLGGLALFGVVMLLISASFSWYFDSEFAVQLKATLMGSIAVGGSGMLAHHALVRSGVAVAQHRGHGVCAGCGIWWSLHGSAIQHLPCLPRPGPSASVHRNGALCAHDGSYQSGGGANAFKRHLAALHDLG